MLNTCPRQWPELLSSKRRHGEHSVAGAIHHAGKSGGSVSFQVEDRLTWPFHSVGSSFRKCAALPDTAGSTTKEETLPIRGTCSANATDTISWRLDYPKTGIGV